MRAVESGGRMPSVGQSLLPFGPRGLFAMCAMVALVCSACVNGGDESIGREPSAAAAVSERSEPSAAFIVENLPADFPPTPLALCLFNEGQSAIAAYRGLVVRESDVYRETPFLRLFVSPPGEEADLPDADQDPVQIDLNGIPAESFTVSTAEPVLHPWPALRWEQDGMVLSLLGEGMEAPEVFDAAASVRRMSQAELDSGGLLDNAAC